MSLDIDEVRKVAKLARLQLTAEEEAQFATQLSQILDYVDMLGEVDTENVEPMAHTADVTNVFREDVPTKSLPREDALSNAPKSDRKYFLVPQIIEGE